MIGDLLVTDNGLGILLQVCQKIGSVFEALIRGSVQGWWLWQASDKKSESAHAVASS